MHNFPILFEDEDLLVIDKPAGIVVNEAQHLKEPTVQSWMADYLSKEKRENDWYGLLPDDFTPEYGSPEEIFAARSGIVHRLDKDTSGALILAKNPGSMLHLMAQFKERQTHKEYTCLVHGKMHAESDTIRLPLLRSTTQRSKFQVAVAGRPAETQYRVVKNYALPSEKLLQLIRGAEFEKGKTDSQIFKEYQSYLDYSLISCQPKTGRTHQIRVHFSYLQHPLVSDQVYTNKWRAKTDVLWCPRQFLHASSITFQHPRTKNAQTITVPLENDLQEVLNFLE